MTPCVRAQFPIVPSYAAGNGTTSLIAVEDFNHDGEQDALVLNLNGANDQYNLNLLLGNGHGGFEAPKTILTNTANIIFTGDFNGDGDPDIAQITSDNKVQVFLNNGHGAFSAPHSTSVLSSKYLNLGAVADFNGDHKLDIVVQDPSNNRILVLLGKGNGTFESPLVTKIPSGTGGGPMVAAKLTESSDIDLAFANLSSHIQIMNGNGKGDFSEGASIKTKALTIYSLVAADFESNGKLSLAASTGFTVWPFLPFCNNVGAGVAVLSPGSGETWSEQDFSTGVDSYGVAAADMNGDGHTDLVVENDLSGTISVLLNKGADSPPQFLSAVNYLPGSFFGGTNIILKDVNGDGKPDVLFIPASGALTVLLNQGGAKFIADRLVETGLKPVSMASSDLNHDKIPDIAMVGFCGASESQFISLLSSGGKPLATKHVNYSTTKDIAGGIGLGDLAGTGNVDAVLGDTSATGGLSLIAMTNNGAGDFSLAKDPDTDLAYSSFILGNFNSGKMADVAAITQSDSESKLKVLLGKGNGQFNPSATYDLGDNPESVVQRDLNGDGISDLVVFGQDDDTIAIYLGKGDGTFEAPRSYSVGGNPFQVAFADFNKDGKMDIAVAINSGVAILMGSGNGTFSSAKLIATPQAAAAIAAADLWGNGNQDVIVAAQGTPSIYVLNGNGKGSFSKPVTYSGGDQVDAIFTGDFDGDGKVDIAEFDSYHTGPIILKNLH